MGYMERGSLKGSIRVDTTQRWLVRRAGSAGRMASLQKKCLTITCKKKKKYIYIYKKK